MINTMEDEGMELDDNSFDERKTPTRRRSNDESSESERAMRTQGEEREHKRRQRGQSRLQVQMACSCGVFLLIVVGFVVMLRQAITRPQQNIHKNRVGMDGSSKGADLPVIDDVITSKELGGGLDDRGSKVEIKVGKDGSIVSATQGEVTSIGQHETISTSIVGSSIKSVESGGQKIKTTTDSKESSLISGKKATTVDTCESGKNCADDINNKAPGPAKVPTELEKALHWLGESLYTSLVSWEQPTEEDIHQDILALSVVFDFDYKDEADERRDRLRIERGMELLRGKLYGQTSNTAGLATFINNLGARLALVRPEEDAPSSYLDEAIALLEEALEMRKKLYGGEMHPDVAQSYLNYAVVLYEGELDKGRGIDMGKRAYEILLATLGPAHPQTRAAKEDWG